MIKAAIFDVDGIIVNSDPIASKSYEYILNYYKIKPQFNEFGLIHNSGVREKDMIKLIKEQYKLEETIEQLIAKKSEFYTDLLKDLKAQPGLIKLLKILKKHNILLSIGSSGALNRTKIKLESAQVSDYFNVLVTGDDVEHGKPAPDIFLTAAERLKVHANECIVFEDAEVGVVAAKKAQMKVIAVPTKYTRQHDFSKADIIVNSLRDVTWEMIMNLY